MADQYDLSPAEKQILIEKAQRREVLRNEFLKQASNPHRHASMEGGAVFDPALQRFMSMKVTNYDHFKVNPKTARIGMLYFIIPLVGFAYLFKSTRDKQEARYRNGEVAYRDRKFKLV